MDPNTVPEQAPNDDKNSPEFLAWYLAKYFWNLTIGDPNLPMPIQEAWFLVNLWYDQEQRPGLYLACKMAVTAVLKRGDRIVTDAWQ